MQPDGVLLTNYHVIETGNIAAVKFPDGTVLPVDGVLAADKTRDVAAIKIHGKDFKTLVLGNSDHVQVGEESSQSETHSPLSRLSPTELSAAYERLRN